MTVTERDETFWREAYAEHGPAVLGFLMRRVRNRDEAEDILHETFVRAIRVDSFAGGNLRGYLVSIAKNLVINKLRRPRLVLPLETPDGVQPFSDVAADEASPERRTSWNLFREKLDAELLGLTEDHRTAFRLAVLEQNTYAEIVEVTGWSLPRVRSNIHRARKKLIEALGPFLDDQRGASS